jgi:F-type H+-transporting ATPase subunit delta
MAPDSSPPAADQSDDFDVGAMGVGALYAKALLGATENAGVTEAVLIELDSLVDDVLVPHPKFEAILASDMISYEERAGMLDRVFGGRISPLFLSFLKVLSRHGRGDCLHAIRRAAHAQYDQLRGRVRVVVTTAEPLDTLLAQTIRDQLRGLLAAEPVLVRRTDPQLIGGLVLRIGDTVYDGSVSTQLERVRTQMIHRSVHEIQSRRDRFSNPAGN